MRVYGKFWVTCATSRHVQGTNTISLVSGPSLSSSILVYILDLFLWLVCFSPQLACLGYRKEEIGSSPGSLTRTGEWTCHIVS